MTDLLESTHGLDLPDEDHQAGSTSGEASHFQNGFHPRDRRQHVRRGMNQPLRLIPILENGYPDSDHLRIAMIRDVSSGGIGWEIETNDWFQRSAFVMGLPLQGAVWRYAGVEVCHADHAGTGRVLVGSRFGGFGQEILQTTSQLPSFQANGLKVSRRFPAEMLEKWAEVGILQPDSLDRVQVCPRCQGLPTFRPGCRHCGSADVGNQRLMHHYACAYVGLVADFETSGGLVCPKCRTRSLVVGVDYEYLTGPYVCRQCPWSDVELEQVARCLLCGFSFPARHATLQTFENYRAERLDPQAVLHHLEVFEMARAGAVSSP